MNPLMIDQFRFAKKNLPDMEWFHRLNPDITEAEIMQLEATIQGRAIYLWMHFEALPLGAAFEWEERLFRKSDERRATSNELEYVFSDKQPFVRLIGGI